MIETIFVYTGLVCLTLLFIVATICGIVLAIAGVINLLRE